MKTIKTDLSCKNELLHQALRELGPSTAKEVAAHTGLPIKSVRALLSWGPRTGRFVEILNSAPPRYRLPGMVKAERKAPLPQPDMLVPAPAPSPSAIPLFHMYTEAGAAAENRGNYAHALSCWQKAERLARHQDNIQWCRRCAEFCQSMGGLGVAHDQ